MPSGVSRNSATRLMTLFLATALPAVAPGQEVATITNGASAQLPIYNYVLSGGDRVRVVVFGDPALGGEFTIAGSGMIAMPLIGEVDVRGLTSTQLQDRIVARLADGYIKDPRVAVEVLSTRPFYILGEVNNPANIPLPTD